MTSLLEGGRSWSPAASDRARLQGSSGRSRAARGRLDDDLLDEAEAVVDRAAARLRLSADHTVVAIAGATGSGKSSTFNALTGLELSAVGVRRPTTSWATGVRLGRRRGDRRLLDWLGIPPGTRPGSARLDARHRPRGHGHSTASSCSTCPTTTRPRSPTTSRSTGWSKLADLLIWVLDPQKYADAAVHDRYLAPLATHAGVMLVVLNHIDTIASGPAGGMLDDVKRLLANDGLAEVTVIPISAREGIGVEDLRRRSPRGSQQKRSTTGPVEADVAAAAGRLDRAGGDAAPRVDHRGPGPDLEERVAEAAGVPTMVGRHRAVGRPRREPGRGRRPPRSPVSAAVGWPGEGPGYGTGSQPQAVAVQRAAVDNGIRQLPTSRAGPRHPVGRCGPPGRRRGRPTTRSTCRGCSRRPARCRLPGWVGLVRVVQWLLFLGAVGGGVWWAALAIRGPRRRTRGGGIRCRRSCWPAVWCSVYWCGALPTAAGAAVARGDAADHGLREVVSDVLAKQVVPRRRRAGVVLSLPLGHPTRPAVAPGRVSDPGSAKDRSVEGRAVCQSRRRSARSCAPTACPHRPQRREPGLSPQARHGPRPSVGGHA